MASITDRLVALCRDNLDLDRAPDPDIGFAESGVSSVDAVALIKLAAETFGVAIEPEDVAGFTTLRDLASHIEAKSG